MYKSKHAKSKSDTDFNVNKIINDEITGSLKIFQNNLLKEIKSNNKDEKKKLKIESNLRKSTKSNRDEDYVFAFIFEKILLFKKQLDLYFFRKKLPLIKFDLDNILIIINKKIEELKNKFIQECSTSHKLFEKLNEFSEVIKSLIETKPQEFYKEIKFVILRHFEKIRLEIFELLENGQDYEDNRKKDINKIKNDSKFNHGILFNSLPELNNTEEDNSNNNCNLNSEAKENIISEILPNKNKILQFIEDITHEILFSLTNFSYIIDYYSLSISYLNLQLFNNIISYVEMNKTKTNSSINKQNKSLFLIELILILNRTFTKKSLNDFQNKVNASELSIQNSMGKFILNNINELIPKCQGLSDMGNSLFNKLSQSLFTKSTVYYSFYKNYMKLYETTNKKVELVKSFKLYYNLKLIFWKSVYTKIDESTKTTDICCRICEQKIPLNEFVLHVYYCNEQNHYYKKMNNFKSKVKKHIKLLEIYRTKINQKLCQDNSFFKKNKELNKILKKIQNEQEFNIDNNNNKDFLYSLIQIYTNEIKKANDFYEANPDKLPIVSTIIYLTYFVYILNKKQSLNNNNQDEELNDILGNILAFFLKILLNTEYLLEARQSKTKSNSYRNNINHSFLSSSNDSFVNSDYKYHSTKNIIFKDSQINNTQKNNVEEDKRRNASRKQTISMMMEDIKNKFSFNKALLNQNNSNQIMNLNQTNDDISLSLNSSISAHRFENGRRKRKSITIKEMNTFFEMRSYSENKSDGVFNFFFNSQKKLPAPFKNDIILEKSKNNNIINHCRTFRNNPFIFKNKKSANLIFEHEDIKKDKEHIIEDNDKNIFNFERKDSSFDAEYSNSKEFLSMDKKSNLDSLSSSFINLENEKDKNDKNDNIFNVNRNCQFISAKTNNNIFNNSNEKKIPSLFSKSDKIVLNYKPYLSYKEGTKQSLFKVSNENNFRKPVKIKTIIPRDNTFDKIELGEKYNEALSENGDLKSKNVHFEKFDPNEKKRGKSPDVNTEKGITKSVYEKNKNLVLIDNCESSSEKASEKTNKNSTQSNNIFKAQTSKNKNINLILNYEPKYKEIIESSDDSSNEDDNDNDYFNNVIIENAEEGEKKIKKGSQNNSFSEDLNEYNNIFNNLNEEENWFNFDTNFFMNSDINAQNEDVVNTIKELLTEINNDNEEEKNDKEDNNEDNELENCKSNTTLKNNSGESNIKMSIFKLVLPIAKGGYGTVGLYKKSSTGDMFAIKSVDINNIKEKKLSKTLQNERNILKGISSDYVVNSYYIFKDNKNYYFVMEYLPGGDVYHLLSSIILPFSTIQLIIAETLLAVYYLHSINIIHHDIKPENILIAKDGHFKLSDFGLSKTINKEEIKEMDEELNRNISSSYSSGSSLNNLAHEDDDNKVEGTLYYMAPELFTSEFPVGKSIDYWAIGIVIFELFTFKIPFEDETQEKTKQNIIDYNINWEPIHSEEVVKNYKNNIDSAVDLIKKFIFFNPEKRWGDNNFEQIKNHEFFKGFDWANIKKIKNSAVLSYLKKMVEKNNKKIKELNKEKGGQNNNNLICEVDMAYDESNMNFSQRIDNLQKRNKELIKMKFKKKEIKIEDDDKNFKNSLLFDLQ